MNPKNTFTKKDVIVVLICFIFLLANIAAIGEGGRKRAQEAACLANLLKWGQIFQAYTADNDGYFHSRQVGTIQGYTQFWLYIYKPYYIDQMIRCCPAADKPECIDGPFAPWSLNNYSKFGSWNPRDQSMWVKGEDGPPFGSYGMNRYVENLQSVPFSSDPALWRRAGVKGADNVPVFFDCMYINIWGNNNADPPEYNGDYDNEMKCACIERHSKGTTNVLFLDWSARKTGLKELWTLKWSRTSDTCGFWTICGNGGSKTATAAKWDAQSPWMKDLPEY